MTRFAAVLAAFVLVLVGCSSPAPGGGDTPADTNVRPSAGETSVAVPGTTVLARDLDVPWDMAILPDGGVLVTLRNKAQLVRVADGRTTVVDTVKGVVPDGEGGLLGIALSPTFSDDQLIYLYFTAVDDNRVVRYHYSADGLSRPTPILTGIPKANHHDGGRLRFGPDGYLYIGTGDAGQPRLAQDTRSLAGKVLRITADGGVPGDNPFNNLVYSYGHRNVEGLGWDASGQFYASELGQDTWDELNVIRAGGNYGWPNAEGRSDDTAFVNPILVWKPFECSPSGIAVTAGGTVYVAALRGERVWRATRTDTGTTDPEVFLDGLGRIRAVEVVDEQLYLLTDNTFRGSPKAGDDQLVSVPLA